MLDDYPGSFESWQSFGKWAWELTEGRDELPPEAVKKVLEITGGLETKKEKVEALYRYLQSTTRYVSVQLGIG
jgi:transglutaminase-like putative cysteine protease